MNCTSCSDSKVTEKGSYWAIIVKRCKGIAGSVLTRGRVAGLKLAAVLLPVTCAHPTPCTLFSTPAVLFLSAGYKPRAVLLPSSPAHIAFPHTHLTGSRSGRAKSPGTAWKSDLLGAGWRQSTMPAAQGDKLYPGAYQDG